VWNAADALPFSPDSPQCFLPPSTGLHAQRIMTGEACGASAAAKDFSYILNAAFQDIPLSAFRAQDEASDIQCSICYCLMESPVKLVKCTHLVHSECIDQVKAAARGGRLLCPLCRKAQPDKGESSDIFWSRRLKPGRLDWISARSDGQTCTN
jgi:hypothetical protein